MRNNTKKLILALMTSLVLGGCGTDGDIENDDTEIIISEVKQKNNNETIELCQDLESDSNISVIDTIAPDVTVKNNVKAVDFGSKIKADDYVEVKDENDVALYFVTESGDESELEIPTDIDILTTKIDFTVVAVDTKGNRSKSITVTIPIAHDFSAEILDKEEGKLRYEIDEFTCSTCGAVYSESALDDVTGEALYDADITNFIIEDIEKKMITTQVCNVRTGPSIEFEKMGSLATDEVVVVTGYCEEENWYRIKKHDEEVYIAGDYLSEIKNNKISSSVSEKSVYESESKITHDQYESANDVFTGEEIDLDTLPTIDWNDIVPGQPAFLWDEATSSWVLNPYYRNIGENWY